MSDKITITKEMLLAADDYIPSSEKEAWVSDTASKCFDRLEITSDGEQMPQMYMVNTGLKSRYLMAMLLRYLKQGYEAEENDPSLITEADYDRWASSHAINQIERWKKDVELRDKCYDILYDFHDLKKRLTSQLMGLLTVQNDSVLRQSQYMTTQLQTLPTVLEQLKELQEARNNAD